VVVVVVIDSLAFEGSLKFMALVGVDGGYFVCRTIKCNGSLAKFCRFRVENEGMSVWYHTTHLIVRKRKRMMNR
jgi:hypothetical protein